MTELNGDVRSAGQQLLQRLAHELPIGPEIVALPPFDQRIHDQMLEQIDKVAQDWVSELQHVRANNEKVERFVIERISKVKTTMTQLYLLGSMVKAEAARGDNVNEKLGEELDKLLDEVTA